MRLKTITIAAFTALLITSCNQDELSRSQEQRDSLVTVLRERESNLQEKEKALDDFIDSFNEVERNLDCVAVRQHLIYSSTEDSKGEMRGTQREKINAQINAINELMEKNRKTIADLQGRIKKSNLKNSKLQKTVETLTGQLAQKDAELVALNERLNALNMQVAKLQTALDSTMAMNSDQSRTIAENVAALHTAYYVVGKSKDLKEAKIIDRKGGVLGLGKTSRLSQNFDASRFTKIDYTQTTTISVNSKQVRIVTTHPADSYRMERDGKDRNLVNTIVITNPEKFWSASKFLVIEGSPVKSETPVSARAEEQGTGN